MGTNKLVWLNKATLSAWPYSSKAFWNRVKASFMTAGTPAEIQTQNLVDTKQVALASRRVVGFEGEM
jgi:hypothetical protein